MAFMAPLAAIGTTVAEAIPAIGSALGIGGTGSLISSAAAAPATGATLGSLGTGAFSGATATGAATAGGGGIMDALSKFKPMFDMGTKIGALLGGQGSSGTPKVATNDKMAPNLDFITSQQRPTQTPGVYTPTTAYMPRLSDLNQRVR